MPMLRLEQDPTHFAHLLNAKYA